VLAVGVGLREREAKMANEMLVVPARFVGLFREGVVDEIRLDADALRQAADTRTLAIAAADLQRSLGQVADDIALLARLPEGGQEGDLTLDDVKADVVAHACESMARAVCGPRLADRLGVGPFERDLIGEIVVLTDAIEWAAEQADRFHGIAADERKAA
jgi:hypothetical protein